MAKPLAISVSRPAAAMFLLLAAVFLAGHVVLPGMLGLDLDCAEGGIGRKARIVEICGCALAAGPKGWLFLAWLIAPIVLLWWWLRSALRRASGHGTQARDGDNGQMP